MSQFEQWEIEHAQDNLNIQPSNSPYWDSRQGQDDLHVIRELNLQPTTTEQERRRLHRKAMRNDLEDEVTERECDEWDALSEEY